MTMNAGVWIDHHKAVVILLTGDGQEMLQFRAGRFGPVSGWPQCDERVYAK